MKIVVDLSLKKNEIGVNIKKQMLMQTLKKQRCIYKIEKNEIGINIKKHVVMQNIEKSRGRYSWENRERLKH